MNIQGLDVFSLLSGGQGSSDATQSVQSIFSGKQGLQGFGEALQGQIALLQQQADLAQMLPDGAIPAKIDNLQSLLGSFRQIQDGQDLASLTGENLPSVKKITEDIDLEKTLQTLRDVLQFAASAAAQITDGEGNSLSRPATPALEKLQDDLTMLDQQLAAVMAPMVTDGADIDTAQKTVFAAQANRVIPGNSEKKDPQQENLLQQTVKNLQ